MSTKSCHLICKIDLNNNNYNYLSIYSLHAVEFTSIMYMFYVYYASTYNGRRLSQNISSSHGFTVFMPHFNHQSRYIATAGIVIFSIVLLNTVTGLICHSHWSSYIAKTTRERKNPVKLLKTLMLDIDNWQPSHFLEWNYTLWITLMSNMQVAGNVLVLNTSYNMY